jgi:hypothetical protein
MMNRISSLILMTSVLATIPACSDTMAPNGRPSEPSEPRISASNTASVPEEFERSATILRYWADAGFDVGRAYAQAFMRFFANRAEARVELSLRDGTSIVATRSGRTSDGWLLPAVRNMWAQATAGAGSSCGHVVDASASFHAWHEAQTPFGRLKWSEQYRSASDSALQPSCSSSCADQVVVIPGESCDEYRSGSGGATAGGGGPTDDLDCHEEFVVITVEGRVIYAGFATVCE